jgi:hypothetical protein
MTGARPAPPTARRLPGPKEPKPALFLARLLLGLVTIAVLAALFGGVIGVDAIALTGVLGACVFLAVYLYLLKTTDTDDVRPTST